MESILVALGQVILVVLNMVQILIFASVMISWVNADPSNPIVNMVRNVTEPLYRPFRPLTRKLPGPIDWAPMALILVIVFLDRLIRQLLRG
jgi:YggT family protein